MFRYSRSKNLVMIFLWFFEYFAAFLFGLFYVNAFHQKVISGPDVSTIGKAAVSIILAWSSLTVHGAVQELKKAERPAKDDDDDDEGHLEEVMSACNIVESVPLCQLQSYPLG